MLLSMSLACFHMLLFMSLVQAFVIIPHGSAGVEHPHKD